VPFYEFQCPGCGRENLFLKSLGDNDQDCPHCGAAMTRTISPVNFSLGPVGAYGYYDETLDRHIGTNREHREEMRRQGVTPKGESVKPDGSPWV